MSLKHSYTLLAPVYDSIVRAATEPMRRASLQSMSASRGDSVLLAGFGTGLDVPYLQTGIDYFAMDLTPAMLRRARRRIVARNDIHLHSADVMRMPYANETFDKIVLHLILAVVPEPLRVLQESARVLKPGGRIWILDKFLRPGQRAPVRRSINLFIRHIATRTDVVFEDLLDEVNGLRRICDEPAMAGGWFRRIILEKTST